MIALIATAMIMGAVGSTHCIGMCGPIALSLPVVKESNFSKFLSSLLYNFGRVITYACIGLIMGMIGQTFALFGFQQILSIGLGVGILVFLFIPAKVSLLNKSNPLSVFFSQLRKKIGSLFMQRNYAAIFMIGLLNGLLPCGLVYLALAGAVATGDPFRSSVFMAAFGLGTLPLMWTVAFFGTLISIRTRTVFRKAYPLIMGLMGCLLILRGLGLDIPFISPALHNNHNQAVIECHN